MTDVLYLAANYSPGPNIDEAVKFYDTLSIETKRFQKLGKVLLVGDFNARMGDLTGDHGECANGRRLRALTLNCKLANLNQKFTKGQYTYKYRGSKSIIDYALSNMDISGLNLRIN